MMWMRWFRHGFPATALLLALTPLAAGAAAASPPGPEVPVTTPAPPQQGGPRPTVAELESQMLALINAERIAAGIPPVGMQPWAHSIAEQHSQAMAAAGAISHDIAGYMATGHQAMSASYLGENVATDSTLAADDTLLNGDPPHRSITLDSRFNYVGIGVAYGTFGAGTNWVYLTENFAEIHGPVAPPPASSNGGAATATSRTPAPDVRPTAPVKPVPPAVVTDVVPVPAATPVTTIPARSTPPALPCVWRGLACGRLHLPPGAATYSLPEVTRSSSTTGRGRVPALPR
jgi:uncharacterized protein YkwD